MTCFNKKISIYLAQKAQIDLLLDKKVIISIKYIDYVNLFWKKLVAKPFKSFNINKYSINPMFAK